MLEWVYIGLVFIVICYDPFHLSHHKAFSLKLLLDSSLLDAHINGLFLNSSLSPDNQLFYCEEVATPPLFKFHCNNTVMICYHVWLHAQWALVSTKITIKFCFFFKHIWLVRLILRDPSLERKNPTFFLNIGSVVTLRLSFHNQG